MSVATDALDEIAAAYRRGAYDTAVSMARVFILDHGVGEWGRYAVEACDNDPRIVDFFRMHGGEDIKSEPPKCGTCKWAEPRSKGFGGFYCHRYPPIANEVRNLTQRPVFVIVGESNWCGEHQPTGGHHE